MTTIEQIFPAPGRGPTGLAFDGRFLWNADYASGKIFKLDLETGDPVDWLICPGNLSGLSWDGKWLWQSLHDAGWIRAIDPETTDYDQTIIVPDHWLSGVAWDGQFIWAASQQRGQLLALDPETSQIVRQLPASVAIGSLAFHEGLLWFSCPEAMRFDSDYSRFEWTSSEERFFLVGIDPETGAEQQRHPFDFLPMGLAWIGEDLWVSHTGGQRLCRVRLD